MFFFKCTTCERNLTCKLSNVTDDCGWFKSKTHSEINELLEKKNQAKCPIS